MTNKPNGKKSLTNDLTNVNKGINNKRLMIVLIKTIILTASGTSLNIKSPIFAAPSLIIPLE